MSNHSQRLIVDSDTIFSEDNSDLVVVVPFVVLQILGNFLDWADYIPGESVAAVHSYVQDRLEKARTAIFIVAYGQPLAGHGKACPHPRRGGGGGLTWKEGQS